MTKGPMNFEQESWIHALALGWLVFGAVRYLASWELFRIELLVVPHLYVTCVSSSKDLSSFALPMQVDEAISNSPPQARFGRSGGHLSFL